VTGAGTGIGARTAVRLAEAGADVALHHFGRREDVDGVVDAVRRAGVRGEAFMADFGSDAAVAGRIVSDVVAAFGRLDVLVNNAAAFDGAEFETIDAPDFERVLRVNVVAPFMAAQAAGAHMASRPGGGRIINIGSIHGRMTSGDMPAYATSKGAIEGLTVTLAARLSPFGVAVTCIVPGAIRVEAYGPDFDDSWWLEHTPLGRLGEPDDIARLVVHLARAESAFATGSVIVVDGGVTRFLSVDR
jgi:3-oxoacyl-[acyl-carrier protein] reductase